jgi:hypothetical protein
MVDGMRAFTARAIEAQAKAAAVYPELNTRYVVLWIVHGFS